MVISKLPDLNEILHLLSEDVIYEKIDAPIDSILNKYSYSISDGKTQKEFISIISKFLQQLKNQGVLVSMNSNEFSEVFWYLEKYYKGEESQGYETALNDYREYGIETILEETCEALKMDQRSRYLTWVHDTKIIYLNWETKLLLVQELMNKFSNILSPSVTEMPHEQLALFIPELLKLINDSVEGNKSTLETKLFN